MALNDPAPGLFVHVPFAQLEEAMPYLVAQGRQPEVAFSAEDLDGAQPAQLKRIGDALHEAGLDLTVHAPHNDLNPGAFDPLVVEVTRRRFLQSLTAAQHLGARLLVFHPGYDPWRYGFREEIWLQRSLRFWHELLEHAKSFDLPLALENVFDTHPDPLATLLSTLGSSLLGCCFDIGHWHLFHRQPLAHWMDTLAPHLVHLHLHDNNGQRDDHLPLGQGGIDFPPLFALLKLHRLQPSLTVESRSLSDADASLAALGALLHDFSRRSTVCPE